MNPDLIKVVVKEHGLPDSFTETVEAYYLPIARSISDISFDKDTCFIGVQGCQGSGKSTLAAFLKVILEEEFSLKTAVLSIDDFYLTKAERENLAVTVHPLLATRGVPGTHDVRLAIDTIKSLKKLKENQSTLIPRFNKATDERFPEDQWCEVSGPIKVVILEGWCVGLEAQEEKLLERPVNSLEEIEDSDMTWRSYVNQQLATQYKELFARFDLLVVLKAPSFDAVYQWRVLQEQKLIKKMIAAGIDRDQLKTMSPEEIRVFISHYQRLTEHGLKTLPKRADWVLKLESNHRITATTCTLTN